MSSFTCGNRPTAPKWPDPVHYDLTEQIKGGVIKNSIRAFSSVMRRLPVEYPTDVKSVIAECKQINEYTQLVVQSGRYQTGLPRSVGDLPQSSVRTHWQEAEALHREPLVLLSTFKMCDIAT